MENFDRIKILFGEDDFAKIQNAGVIVFGLGGVGGWCAEALVRSGIQKIGIVDFDKIEESNINRQIIATTKTLGQAKADVFKERILEINPNCKVKSWEQKFTKENAKDYNIADYNYVIDAIDIIENKIDLIILAKNQNVKFYSSMGMAQKINPLNIKIADIWDTKGCPLAKKIRTELRACNFAGNFLTVYSSENIARHENFNKEKKIINGSLMPVTAAAGMILASLVINDIIGLNEQ
jgi:tRNA A37 threonylcarbamoyladenosine dehydratase